MFDQMANVHDKLNWFSCWWLSCVQPQFFKWHSLSPGAGDWGVLGCRGSLWPDSEHLNPRLLELLAKCVGQGKVPAAGNLPGRLWKTPPNSSKKRRHKHLFRIPKEHSSRIHAHVTHSHAQPPLEGPGVLQTDKRLFIRTLEDRSSVDLECCHCICREWKLLEDHTVERVRRIETRQVRSKFGILRWVL